MASQQTIMHGMQIPPPSPQRGSACASGFHRARGSLHRKRARDMRPPAARRRTYLRTGYFYRDGPRSRVTYTGANWWH